MKKYFVILTVLLFGSTNSYGQHADSLLYEAPCKVHFKYELPVLAAGFFLARAGYGGLAKKATLSQEEVLALNPNNVNSFDRPVLDFPASGYSNAQSISDYMLYGSFALPSLLFFDKKIRRDWKEFASIYFETHLASSLVYLGATFTIPKPRPLTYNIQLSMEDRTGKSKNNSFFSGHVNSTAASTFFMANMYTTYNDLTLGQKALVYTAAAIPPAIVARYRMRAGKHFRTDVIAGFLVGAASGILVPELHRRRGNKCLTYMPYFSGNNIGLAMNYKF